MNVDYQWDFTECLWDLMKNQRLSLVESLEIMGNQNYSNKKCACAGRFLLSCLEKGCTFSMALRRCESIHFDESFILFISLAERTGNLAGTIDYLKKKGDRYAANRKLFLEACIYPMFVILLAVFGSIFLIWYGKDTLFNFSFDELDLSSVSESSGFFGAGKSLFESGYLKNIGSGYGEIFLRAFSFLLIYCFFSFYGIGKILTNDKRYEAFMAANFLTKEGINISEALSAAVFVCGIGDKEGKLLLDAKRKLESGIELSCAFGGFGPNIQKILYFAKYRGKESEIFEKISERLKLEIEKKQKICVLLVEPVFLIGTGGFLMILLSGLFGKGILGFM